MRDLWVKVSMESILLGIIRLHLIQMFLRKVRRRLEQLWSVELGKKFCFKRPLFRLAACGLGSARRLYECCLLDMYFLLTDFPFLRIQTDSVISGSGLKCDSLQIWRR